MSVWVMTSPFTIAVAFTTEGIACPKIWGLSGSFSALALPPAGGVGSAAFCAAAPVATASTNAAVASRSRAGKKSNAAGTSENPLLFNRMSGSAYIQPR
jgi:hypothetical protein